MIYVENLGKLENITKRHTVNTQTYRARHTGKLCDSQLFDDDTSGPIKFIFNSCIDCSIYRLQSPHTEIIIIRVIGKFMFPVRKEGREQMLTNIVQRNNTFKRLGM